MKIGTREVGPGHPTFILAEIGTNHMGSVDEAVDHIDGAAEAGVDGVKFQIFVEYCDLFCPMPGDETRQERWSKSVMDLHCWKIARRVAQDRGMAFIASVFQHDAIDLVKQLDLDAVKVASRANTSFPYDEFEGPFIVSQNPLGAIVPKPAGAIVLYCIPEYPPCLKKVMRIGSLGKGLSDHSGTPWPGIQACFDSATMVEVHFGLEAADMGPDKPVCLNQDQLKLICEARDAAAGMS